MSGIVRRRLLALALGIAALAASSPVTAVVPLEPVVIRGDAAPGLPGAKFQFFAGAPFINQQGEVGFYGSLEGAGAADFAIWAGRRDDLTLVAREGDVAPGSGGAHFSTASGFNLYGLANDRQALFLGYLSLSDPGVTVANDETMWFGAAGNIQRISREGDLMPTSPYLQAAGNPLPLVSPAGKLAYSMIDAYYGPAGAVRSLQLVNQPASGAGDDRFGALGVVGVNASGQLLATARLYDPEAPAAASGQGLWLIDSRNPTQAQKVARGSLAGNEGSTLADPAPGTAYRFTAFNAATINNQGTLAVYAATDGPADAPGIWLGSPGQLQLLGRPGTTVSAGGQQLTIADFSAADGGYMAAPLLNGRGEAAFMAKLAGAAVTAANDRALFLGSSAANLRIVAREGDHAPGTPDGVTFEHFANVAEAPYTPPALNARGQMAFQAVLAGPGVDKSNDIGLFATNTLGQPFLVAREGQVADLEPWLSGTISQIEFAGDSGGQDGRGIAFNDLGQLTFRISLKNPSVYQRDQAVVTALVPEPQADFDVSGIVNFADVAAWSQHFGAATGALAASGDADHDGDVDGGDFIVWQRQLGSTQIMTAGPIPEPSGLALAAIAWPAAVARIRRKRQA